MTLTELAAFAFVSIVATAVAFVAWFTGLRHLPASAVGLVGLMNPVTGVLLGTLIASETLTGRQIAGIGLVLAGIALGQVTSGPDRRASARSGSTPDSSRRNAPLRAAVVRSCSFRADRKTRCQQHLDATD